MRLTIIRADNLIIKDGLGYYADLSVFDDLSWVEGYDQQTWGRFHALQWYGTPDQFGEYGQDSPVPYGEVEFKKTVPNLVIKELGIFEQALPLWEASKLEEEERIAAEEAEAQRLKEEEEERIRLEMERIEEMMAFEEEKLALELALEEEKLALELALEDERLAFELALEEEKVAFDLAFQDALQDEKLAFEQEKLVFEQQREEERVAALILEQEAMAERHRDSLMELDLQTLLADDIDEVESAKLEEDLEKLLADL